MTILPGTGSIPDADAVLVRVEEPPDPRDDRALDVRPGAGETVDGDRHLTGLAFVYGDRPRRSYTADELPPATSAATDYLREGGTVRLGNRATLRAVWPTATIRRIERELVSTARATDGTVLAWTDAADPDDEGIYDLVVRPDA